VYETISLSTQDSTGFNLHHLTASRALGSAPNSSSSAATPPHPRAAAKQGLTLVHFSAQPEPVLTQSTPLKAQTNPPTPPKQHVNNPQTTPNCTPYPTQSA